MSSKCLRFWRWFCAPDDVGILPAFFLFCGGVVLVCTMSAFYHGVVMDYDTLKENPMHRMINDLDRFTRDVEGNVSGQQLMNDYPWLKHFRTLVEANCSIMTTNLKYLRSTGYILAAYNTLLMRIFLSGTLPVSVVACFPIMASLVSSYIDPAQIVLLGLFEFTQGFLLLIIMGTFIVLKEKKTHNPVPSNFNKFS